VQTLVPRLDPQRLRAQQPPPSLGQALREPQQPAGVVQRAAVGDPERLALVAWSAPLEVGEADVAVRRAGQAVGAQPLGALGFQPGVADQRDQEGQQVIAGEEQAGVDRSGAAETKALQAPGLGMPWSDRPVPGDVPQDVLQPTPAALLWVLPGPSQPFALQDPVAASRMRSKTGSG
jgi:hypothetical protein